MDTSSNHPLINVYLITMLWMKSDHVTVLMTSSYAILSDKHQLEHDTQEMYCIRSRPSPSLGVKD